MFGYSDTLIILHLVLLLVRIVELDDYSNSVGVAFALPAYIKHGEVFGLLLLE